MDKKEKDKEEFLGNSQGMNQEGESSISSEIHRKAERIARALMASPREPKKKKGSGVN